MVKIILDTDLGRDCDDAGALALLHTLASEGNAQILAITLCTSAISSAITVKAINEWYERPDIPIGKYTKKEFLEEEICQRFTKPIMEKYLKNNREPVFEDAVKVLRKSLAENDDVTIAVIGMQNNIADLIRSMPDDISPLNGRELIEKSVKNIYVMGGNFVDSEYKEYNIVSDVKSAKYVSENCPVPIIYCGFELGVNIKSGTTLVNTSDENPVKYSYVKHCTKERIPHFSWDPITVYCSVCQESDLYKLSEKLKISFDDEARTIINGKGKDCFLIADSSDAEIQLIIDGLIKG